MRSMHSFESGFLWLVFQVFCSFVANGHWLVSQVINRGVQGKVILSTLWPGRFTNDKTKRWGSKIEKRDKENLRKHSPRSFSVIVVFLELLNIAFVLDPLFTEATSYTEKSCHKHGTEDGQSRRDAIPRWVQTTGNSKDFLIPTLGTFLGVLHRWFIVILIHLISRQAHGKSESIWLIPSSLDERGQVPLIEGTPVLGPKVQ